MLTHQTARIATISILAAVTTSAMLAAKPTPRHISDAPAMPMAKTSYARIQAEIPADLEHHRLKVRFRSELGTRLLPDGRLLSLRGQDLTALSDMLDRLNVSLSPAINLPESTLVSLRSRIESAGGSTAGLPDLGATFWVDGHPDAVRRTATRLALLSEIDSIAFVRTPQRSGFHASQLPQSADVAPEPMTPTFEHVPEYEISSEEIVNRIMERFPLPEIPTEAELVASSERARDALDHQRVNSIAQIAKDNAAQVSSDRPLDVGDLRGATGACCVFTYQDDVNAGRGPGYLRTCEILTEDECDAMIQPDGSVVTEYQDDGTTCTACNGSFWGACGADIGIRDGEDKFIQECTGNEIWWGTFNPPAPTPPGSEPWDEFIVAFNNCDAAPLQYGTCCFGSTGAASQDLLGGDEQHIKFFACDTLGATTPNAPGLPGPVANSPADWTQPDVEPATLAGTIGVPLAVSYQFMPTWQGTEVNQFAPGLNRPGLQVVMNSARLVTNTAEETACSRCVGLGGAWMGPTSDANPATYPVIPFDGTLVCGNQGPNFTGCDGPAGINPDPNALNWVMGACTSAAGSTSITTYQACADAATVMNVRVDRIWMGTLINPARIDATTGLHDVHQNNFRPMWTLWFTPSSNSEPAPLVPGWVTWCPPLNPFNPDLGVDPLCDGVSVPNTLVPLWDYVGTQVEWTGWDPGRWWDEGVTLGLTRDEFLDIYPDIASEPGGSGTGVYPGWTSADAADMVEPRRVTLDPGLYGPTVRFGLPPTCDEYIEPGGTNTGLATLRGNPFTWDDPATGESNWPVYPTLNMGVYRWQVDGAGMFTNTNTIFPWLSGWNRWTDDSRLFDIDQGIQANPAFHLGGRYVQLDQPGLTKWEPQDYQAPVPPTLEDAYIFPRYVADAPPTTFEGTLGDCFFPHSARFPTLPGTDDNTIYPGEQECYIGDYCDDSDCCTAVAGLIPRCCDGTGETWDASCAQVALILAVGEQQSDTPFADRVCAGITPYLVPEYPNAEINTPTYTWPEGLEIPDELVATGQYNWDPRNITLNPYLHGVNERDIVGGVLPQFINPAYAEGLPCETADLNPTNQFWPPSPVPASDPGYAEYAQVREQTARLFQFMPRCMLIHSSAGQCNVPGTVSGRSAWSDVADDEGILIGCQDFDCCMRIMAHMLELKDTVYDPEHQYSDFEWMPKQWTPQMAMFAREMCYPELAQELTPIATDLDPTPDYFPLQLHAGAAAYQDILDQGGNLQSEWIVSPDGSTLTDNTLLRDLTWAPFSYSNVNDSTFGVCEAPHQNAYGLCPEPYYRASGMAIWPESSPAGIGTPSGGGVSFAAEVNAISEATGRTYNAFGEGVRVAVLGESAWLQQWTSTGGTEYGAVHEDLGNVILEGPSWGFPEVYMDFSDEQATARCTAALGVLAATDNSIGVTGMAHDAEVFFFPTHHIPGAGGPVTNPVSRVRTENAFVHALSVLRPGDIMLLALDSESPDGFILNDPTIQGLLPYAEALDVVVVAPAGDGQQAVNYSAASANVITVGGATPSNEDNYIRWWTSNYATENTVLTFQNGAPSVCAWGGGVATTGGNANLSLTTMSPPDPPPAGTGWASGYGYDLYYEDGTATGDYRLTEAGKSRSYTNDFGSQLDGSLAAASQIAASMACMQGFSIAFYEDPLSPAYLSQTMWETATFGNGQPNPAGNAAPPAVDGLNTYTWDVDEAGGGTVPSIGRMPQMARLLNHVLDNPPTEDEFSEPITHRIVALGVISGSQVSGDMFSLMIQGDDDELHLQTQYRPRGWVDSPVWLPGPLIYTTPGEYADFMVTFQTHEDSVAPDGVGFTEVRSGPLSLAFNTCWVFNFARNSWEGFSPLIQVDPADEDPPVTDNFEPFVPAYGLAAYREPGTDRIYVRFMMVTGDSQEVLSEYIDYVDFSNLLDIND